MGVAFEAWSYQVTWLELIAVALALVGIALGIRGSKWMWPPYFVSSVLYAWLFLQAGLVGSAGMQLVFIIAAVWGWLSWRKTATITPQWLSSKQRFLLLGVVVMAWLLLYPLLGAVGDIASGADTLVFVGSVAAQVLMVLTRIEAWVMWLVVNVTGTGLYFFTGLYFTAIFYAVLVVMAGLGLLEWQKLHRDHLTADTEREPGFVHG